MNETTDLREVLREYQVLSEVEGNESISQRDLGKLVRLNISIVNQIVKRLIRKGCIKTRPINGRKLAYYLTPQGFSEKLRLVMRYTRRTIGFFSAVRDLVNSRFSELKDEHEIKTVAIVGTGEVAEAVYLSAREQELTLIAVYDNDSAGEQWLGMPICRLEDATVADVVVVTKIDLPQVECQDLAAIGKYQINMGDLLSDRLTAFASRVEEEEEGEASP